MSRVYADKETKTQKQRSKRRPVEQEDEKFINEKDEIQTDPYEFVGQTTNDPDEHNQEPEYLVPHRKQTKPLGRIMTFGDWDQLEYDLMHGCVPSNDRPLGISIEAPQWLSDSLLRKAVSSAGPTASPFVTSTVDDGLSVGVSESPALSALSKINSKISTARASPQIKTKKTRKPKRLSNARDIPTEGYVFIPCLYNLLYRDNMEPAKCTAGIMLKLIEGTNLIDPQDHNNKDLVNEVMRKHFSGNKVRCPDRTNHHVNSRPKYTEATKFSVAQRWLDKSSGVLPRQSASSAQSQQGYKDLDGEDDDDTIDLTLNRSAAFRAKPEDTKANEAESPDYYAGLSEFYSEDFYVGKKRREVEPDVEQPQDGDDEEKQRKQQEQVIGELEKQKKISREIKALGIPEPVLKSRAAAKSAHRKLRAVGIGQQYQAVVPDAEINAATPSSNEDVEGQRISEFEIESGLDFAPQFPITHPHLDESTCKHTTLSKNK